MPSSEKSQVDELRQVRQGPLISTKTELVKMKPKVVKAALKCFKRRRFDLKDQVQQGFTELKKSIAQVLLIYLHCRMARVVLRSRRRRS